MRLQDNIKYLMNPRSIAIIGCSQKNIGGTTLKNLLNHNYSGVIYPVHPKNEEVFGLKCYKSLLDIPGDVDCCIVALRSSLILNCIEEMHEKGVKAAVIFASGFSEVGVEGKKLQEQVSAKLNKYEIAACGPNCLGLINTYDNAVLYSAACDVKKLRGPIGFVAHSGSACIAMQSANRGLGYSYMISCGNEAGLSVADYFDYLLDDPMTEILVGFLETIRDPKALARVAKKALKKNKPIVILKVGRSEMGQKTAAAHSGALASSKDVIDAFFYQNGIIQVNSFDSLLETCEMLLRLKGNLPKTGKLALTAISGGQLGFMCDVAADVGIKFAEINDTTVTRIQNALPNFATPSNPLDVTTALFDTDAYKECIRALAADDQVGMVMVCQDCEAGMYEKEIDLYLHIIKAISEVKQEIDKPLAVFSLFSSGLVQEFKEILHQKDIPLLQGAHESMYAAKALLDWKKFKSRDKHTFVTGSHEHVLFDFGGKTNLSEHYSKKLLTAYGIPVAQDILVQTIEEAVQAANTIGYPVVLKIDSPDILHKTDAKVIKLNLTCDKDVRNAYFEIMNNAKIYNPHAQINGVSVQEMVDKGIEMLLGVKTDALFGPSILVGIGGIFVEVFKDYSLQLAPIDENLAHEMIENLRGKEILFGARGTPKADVAALKKTIAKLSYLALDYAHEISELDINPLIVLPEGKGIKAVDALVVRRKESSKDGHLKLA